MFWICFYIRLSMMGTNVPALRSISDSKVRHICKAMASQSFFSTWMNISLISFFALERVTFRLTSLFIWIRMLLWLFDHYQTLIKWLHSFLFFYQLIYHVKKFGSIWTFLNFHACHQLNNLIQFVRVFAWYPSQRSSENTVLPLDCGNKKLKFKRSLLRNFIKP